MQRPKLKSFLRQIEDGGLTLTRDAGTAFRLDDPDGSVGALLDRLDGSRTIPEIRAELARRWPALTEAQVAEGIVGLNEAGLLEEAAAATTLTPHQQERYYNNLAFFGTFADLTTSRHQFQERLRKARVVQIGVGGVGSTVLLQLAGLGIGEIVVVDFDRVELKNLARQLLYTEVDLGQPKLARAVARARALNPEVTLIPLAAQINGPTDLARLLVGADLLVLTADSPAALLDWANAACVAAGVPMINGGVGIAKAAYLSVAPGRSGCIACLRALERNQTGVDGPITHPDGIHRGISPVGGLVASLIGLEALRYLSGFAAPVAAGRYWQVDLASGETAVALAWDRRADCPVCGAGGS